MTNKFAPTYRSLESSNYFFGLYMTNGRQRVNAGQVNLVSTCCRYQTRHNSMN